MTDPELIAKKLALIETCVRELQTLSRPAEISRDVREERFVEHTLQIAIQAALHVASSRRGEPRGETTSFPHVLTATDGNSFRNRS